MEVKELLASKDPTYRASFAAVWKESIKETKPAEDPWMKRVKLKTRFMLSGLCFQKLDGYPCMVEF